MGQLAIVVMSIVLLAIVVAGGINYLSTDIGVRTATQRDVSLAHQVLASAVSSYRVANRGALPQSSDWEAEIGPYMNTRPKAPDGMEWSVVGGTTLCLASTGGLEISDAVRDGLENFRETLPDGPAITENVDCTGGASPGSLVMTIPLVADQEE